MSGSRLNVSTPLHVHVKLMGMYVCACRYKCICIAIMGVYNVHVIMVYTCTTKKV